MKKVLCCFLVVVMLLSAVGCAGQGKKEKPLPLPDMDETTTFGSDRNINQSTIDEWLGRDDVAYRDMRMLADPARFEDLGKDSDLRATIEGFRIVPYPYLATLQALPVEGAYDGERLFEVEWTEDGQIKSAVPLYEESMQVLEELFPKDKAIFLMCGGGGYANMTRELLLTLGWDPQKLYHIGGNWDYTGNHAVELVVQPQNDDGEKVYATWRADYAYIDFSLLHKIK